MYYHFKIHKEGDGFWAQCVELPGCVTQATSKQELAENMQEALNLYVSERANSHDLAALPSKTVRVARNIIKVPLDPQVAFAFLVRYWRLQHGWTQKEAAEKMGFETLYSYQRLEDKRCNPSLKILSQVKKVYPELSIDLTVSV